jgi:hypothetical protein
VVNGSSTRYDDYIELQKGKELIACTLTLDVKTRWNSTLEMLERAYRLRDYTAHWLKNPKYEEFRPLFTTDEEWRVVEYVLEVLRPFRYWTLWMSKRHSITLHRVIGIYNDMFDHMEGIITALSMKQTQWKIDIRRGMRAARKKLSSYYAEVTPESGLLLILAHMLDPYRKTRTFQVWDKRAGVDPNSSDSYTWQYKKAFLNYWDQHYVTKIIESTSQNSDNAKSSDKTQLSDTPSEPSNLAYTFDSDSDDNQSLSALPTTTPRRTSRRENLLRIAHQYLDNSRVDPASFGQTNPGGDDTDGDTNPDLASGCFWSASVAAWWKHQVTHVTEYAPLSQMARNIFAVMPHGVGVEASFSLGRDVIGWRQARTSGATLQQKVVVRQWARSNSGQLADASIDRLTQNDAAAKAKAEQLKLRKLASLTDFLYWSKKSQQFRSAQKVLEKEGRKRGKGYISDEEEFFPTTWDQFEDNGIGAFDDYLSNKRPAMTKTRVDTKFLEPTFVKKVPRVDREVGMTDLGTDSENDASDECDLWEDTDFDGNDEFEEEEEDAFTVASTTTFNETEDEPDGQILAAPVIRDFTKPHRSNRLNTAPTNSRAISPNNKRAARSIDMGNPKRKRNMQVTDNSTE